MLQIAITMANVIACVGRHIIFVMTPVVMTKLAQALTIPVDSACLEECRWATYGSIWTDNGRRTCVFADGALLLQQLQMVDNR